MRDLAARHLAAAVATVLAAHGAAVAAPPGGPSPFMGVTLEAAFLAALPAVLTYGQTLGGELAVGYGAGPVSYGVAVSGSVADENAWNWHETFRELRVRARIGLRTEAGRAVFGLRLGLGMSAVRIDRTYHTELVYGVDETEPARDEWVAAPAIELDGGLTLELVDHLGLSLFLGPTVHFGGSPRGDDLWGWRCAMGIVWAP